MGVDLNVTDYNKRPLWITVVIPGGSSSGEDQTRIIRLVSNLAFGNVAIGSTLTRTMTIYNDGSDTLTVSSISYPAGFSGDCSSAMISAGGYRNVTVTFAPSAAQTYSGDITVNSDKTSGTPTLGCSGTGLAVPTSIIRLDGDLAFGNLTVGQAATRTLTIYNDGTSTLTVSTISYPPGFSGNWSSGGIATGSSRNVNVTFAPTAAQAYGGKITVNSDKTSGTSTRACSGTGVATPTVVISAVRVSTLPNSATITWTTSEPANGQIEYGTSPSYGSYTALAPGLTTAHLITISSLSAVTTYYYRILSRDGSGNLGNSDDLSFRTTATPNTSPSVVVGSPNGGETWAVGSVQNITWSAADDVEVTSVSLWYSTNEGVNPIQIASGLANSGTYAWTVPNPPTTLARVFVWAYDAAGAMGADYSDGNFIIAASCPTPAAPVLQPITVPPSGNYTVAWNPVSGADYYVLEESTTADFASPTPYNLTGTSRFIVGWPGTKYYRMRAVNTCGQSAPSNTRIASVGVDQSPGPISIVSPADNATGQPLSVNLCWSCTHPGGESLRYNVYVVPADTEFFSSANIKSQEQTATCFTAVNLPYNTRVSWGIVAIDDTGQESISQVFHFTTIADTSPPTGTISINNGAAATTTYSVSLYLTASDSGSGVMDMRFSNNGTTWSQWYPYATQFPWNLADSQSAGGQPGLSTYTVYAQFRDYQLNTSLAASDSISKTAGTPGLILCNGSIYETIQDAVNAANPGDAVYLTEGTFSVSSTAIALYPGGPARAVGIAMRPGVRLIGAGAAKTTINMVNGFFGILDADNSFVQGIRIVGPSFPTSLPACVLMGSSNSVVQDCWLEGSHYGIQVTWNSQRNASNSRISNNLIRNNSEGLWVFEPASNITVHNNTIVYNLPNVGLASEIASAFIRNNVIVSNSYQVAVREGILPVFQNNDVLPSAGSYGYQGMPNQTGINGNISADPRFANAAANDFRLNAGSPAIDAGVNVGTPFAGAAPDMGAFEANAQGSIHVVSDRTNAAYTITGPSGSYAGTGTNWTLSGVPAGIYSATFFGISNLYSPPLQVKTLLAGQTVTFDGAYSPDTVPPSGSATVNYGEFYTQDPFVTLTLDFEDEVAGMGAGAMMKFSNDGTTWSPVEPYRTVKQAWDLCAFGGANSSGTKIVSVMVCDALGNWATTNTSIIYVPDRRVLEVPTDFATIQAAVNAAIPGDVVHVAPGIYSENVTVAEGVTLLGSGPNRTIFTNQVCMLTLRANVRVEGLGGTIYILAGGPALIANNVLVNALMKVAISEGRVIVRNNLLVNGPRGVQVNSASADALIENNTFVNLSQAAILLPNGIQGTHVEVVNNIFAFNASGITDSNNDPHRRVFATYNTFWMNTNGNYSGSSPMPGAGEVTTDPVFASFGGSDFRLLAGSPCINSGQPAERYNDPDGSRNDRGAYGGPCLNTAPVADFVTTPHVGSVGSFFALDASSSFDRETENAKLLVRWDFDGDGQWDTGLSTSKIASRQFTGLGIFTVVLEVRDERGWITSTNKQIRVENQPPAVPLALSVTNGARSQPIYLTLDWAGGDFDALDTVTYDVYFGTTPRPPLVASDLPQTSFVLPALSYYTFYYWQIVATDNHGSSTFSPVWSFLTQSEPVDNDADGIPDWWTMQYFGHPLGLASDHSRAGDDADSDGLSNLQEYQLGRNPLVADNASLMAGSVRTPGGASVGGVAVAGLAGTPATASDGSYSATFPYGWSGSATPSKTDDDPPANGVSTLDIALIRRHILGMTLLDSPCKILAADVNGSGAVSTLDIALIRRVILGITNGFPAGLWRFVPSDYVFPDPQNPWAAPTNRCHTSLVADVTGQDFVAIKLGDVNNSWVSPALGLATGGKVTGKDASPAGPLPSVRFEVSSQAARPGERVTARVSVGGFRQVTSAQFTLQWDPAVLRYVGVGDFGLRGLSAGSFGAVSAGSGKLTFSWDDPEAAGVTVAAGTTIFTVSLDVTGKAGSGSVLGFGDLPTAREAGVALARAGWESQDGQVAVVGTKPVVACGRDPASGVLWVSVPTDAGRRYVLEFAESLSDARWTALTSVVGDGTIKALADPGPTNQQRFYRVRIE